MKDPRDVYMNQLVPMVVEQTARGERAFVEDMVEPGHCHLKMLGSPHAHAYIRSIDTTAAKRSWLGTVLG